MTKSKTITITEKRYIELSKAEDKLIALECYGVDNWSGYGDAMSSMDEEEEEQH